MRFYTVHLRPFDGAAARWPVLIKEGFCWPATLFTVIWALVNRLWLVAAVLLAFGFLVPAFAAAVTDDPFGRLAINAGYLAIVGYLANDVRRWTLDRRGYATLGVVTGRRRTAAEQRAYEKMAILSNPDW